MLLNLPSVYLFRLTLLIVGFLSISATVFAQSNTVSFFPANAVNTRLPLLRQDTDPSLFATQAYFIENIGQYGSFIESKREIGTILYAYEGLNMPVLFTQKGMAYVHRRIHRLSEEQIEQLEYSSFLSEEKKQPFNEDKLITIEWAGANPNPVVVTENASSHYYTYASARGRAKGCKKITLQGIYPGIDLIYSFRPGIAKGFEYSFLVHPGADISAIHLKIEGDAAAITSDEKGGLIIHSGIEGIRHSIPVSYYTGADGRPDTRYAISSVFSVKGNDIRFEFPAGYDKTKTLLIDPFVSSTANLTGNNAGIAKDIDFDYAGNIYVSGGGSMMLNMLSKFDKNGVLLWTFNGSLSAPVWNFGNNYGGWVVEKTTGKIYLGQGGTGSFQIIRLSTDGLYDNYITDRNINYQENWKMIWNCDGGNPKIMIAGGGSINDNLNLGICTPPATALAPLNITGQTTGHQDIADLVIDPKTNELYSIFAQGFIVPITENNRLYKHRPPYSAANIGWTRLSGFTVLSERANRPYLAEALSFNDNSINALAVNSTHLFYYDGRNLMAMNKSTGATIGSAVTLSLNTALHQGGIIADECNNVYIGSISGTIKVYKFTGTSFDDGAAPDISIAGFPGAAVYDLAYDNAKNFLYACGKGFVAAIDIASYCANTIYTLTIRPDCSALSVKVSVSPSIPAGSTLTYGLYQGNTLVTTNTNGQFSGLTANSSYTVKALIDEACGGTQSVKDFTMNTCSGAPPAGSGIYIPTAFTPNGDGLNDILKVIPYGLKEFKFFSLYNRWGQLIFRTTNPSQGWDGTHNGKKQDSGVFVWQAEAIDFDDKLIKLKGTVTLIR